MFFFGWLCLASLLAYISEDIPYFLQYYFSCPSEKYLARCLGQSLLLR